MHGEQFDWDIFCDVIDNFGDIGVTWRLAKQLANEYPYSVRLWVNDLTSFGAMLPEIANRTELFWQKVQICHWADPFATAIVPARYVIEAFACELPNNYRQAMNAHSKLWLNLEYLSAEDWVDGCHGLPSGLQQIPKYFFFPGFTEATGGVLCEHDYLSRQQQFDEAKFWQDLAIPARQGDELRVSAFTYESDSWPSVLDALHAYTEQHSSACRLIVPRGRALTSLLPLATEQLADDHYRIGAIDLHCIPFTHQERYDELLWACDLNFIRGEDSFIRAQLAAKPFVWHIYPQQEQAHLCKLAAFLAKFAAPNVGIEPLFTQFNEQQNCAEPLLKSLANRELWQQHCLQWRDSLLKDGDLVSRLVKFLNSKV